MINYHMKPTIELGRETSQSKKASFQRQRERWLRSPALGGGVSNMAAT